MGSLLFLGLLIGMRHALEADHVAAIASLSNENYSLKQALRQGSAWGIGHTTTLLLFGSMVLFIDVSLSKTLVSGLEMAVGFMLLVLGLDVLRRVIRDKIHFHRHQHDNGAHHFHAHSHAGEPKVAHATSSHRHQHRTSIPIRALLVGLMHGMAGSAVVILLALETISSPFQGLLYILIFGLGSMIGMALLSVIISVPLRLSEKRLTWAHNAFQVLTGVLTIGLGIWMIHQNNLFFVV